MTNQIKLSKSELSPLQSGMVQLANLDLVSSKVNLVSLANESVTPFLNMITDLQLLTNQLVDSKSVKLAGFNYKDLLLVNRFSQAIKRHNAQILWSSARAAHDTDGETSHLLQHVTVSKDGISFDGTKTKTVKVTRYGTFDCANNSLISFSIERDKELGTLLIKAGLASIDIDGLKSSLRLHLESMPDISLQLTKASDVDATTTPDSTIAVEPDQAMVELANTVQELKQENTDKNVEISGLKGDLITSQNQAIDNKNTGEYNLKVLNDMFGDLSKAKQKKYVNLLSELNDSQPRLKDVAA